MSEAKQKAAINAAIMAELFGINAAVPAFKLGAKVRDKVTGFEGVTMSCAVYSTGCLHYGVAGPVKKDGVVPDWEFFDQTRLVGVDAPLVSFNKDAEDPRGGPTANNPPEM